MYELPDCDGLLAWSYNWELGGWWTSQVHTRPQAEWLITRSLTFSECVCVYVCVQTRELLMLNSIHINDPVYVLMIVYFLAKVVNHTDWTWASLSFKHTHTHSHIQTHVHTHTNTHTHIHYTQTHTYTHAHTHTHSYHRAFNWTIEWICYWDTVIRNV